MLHRPINNLKAFTAGIFNQDLKNSLMKISEQSILKLYIHWVIIGVSYGLFLIFTANIDTPAPPMLLAVGSQVVPEKFLLFTIPCLIYILLKKFDIPIKISNWLGKQIFDFLILVCAKGPVGGIGFL